MLLLSGMLFLWPSLRLHQRARRTLTMIQLSSYFSFTRAASSMAVMALPMSAP
jgi:hypothetical protein